MEQDTEIQFILSLIQWIFADGKGVASDSSIRWDIFYKLVFKHRLWHPIRAALVENGLHPPIFNKLTAQCKKDQLNILNSAGETLRLSKTFRENTIQHCFIKGTVLNEFLYGALGTRPCRDIDVWIDSAHFEKAVDVLIANGYQKKLPTYTLSGFKKQYYMNHKHDIALYHPQKKILVELHFRLSYFGLPFFTQDLVAFKSVLVCNTPVQTLDDDYHLLYLMIHGAIHAWIRLRWLIDILLYIKSQRCSLVRVLSLAEEINCRHIVEQSLLLVRDLFAYENELMHHLVQRAGKRSVQLAQTAKLFIVSDYEFGTSSGIFKKEFFIYRLYLVRLAAEGQKLQALWADLFKIDNLFPFVTLPSSLRFLYYFMYPLWVCKYILWRK